MLLVLLTSCGVLSAQVPTRLQEVDDAKLLDLLKQAAFGKGPLPTPLDHRCRLVKFDGVVHALVVQQVGLHNEKMNWTHYRWSEGNWQVQGCRVPSSPKQSGISIEQAQNAKSRGFLAVQLGFDGWSVEDQERFLEQRRFIELK